MFKKGESDIKRHVHDGFVYARDGVSSDRARIFWRCARRARTRLEYCTGRIHTTSDGDRKLLKVVTEHNCILYARNSSNTNGPLQKGEGETKKRALGEVQKFQQTDKDRGQGLALVVSNYAAAMRSVDELFELVQGSIGDAPIDFTDLNQLQNSIFIREMARKMEKLRLDFEQKDCSECCHCGKQIEKITTENLTVVQLQQQKEATINNGDLHRVVQTANRDSECASLAIHTFLYHPAELKPTLSCLFGSERDARLCYPYLDFHRSSTELLICFICKRRYPDLISFLRHAEMYHATTLRNL